MKRKQKGGLNPLPYDPRDVTVGGLFTQPTTLPSEFSLYYPFRVKDQGQSDFCFPGDTPVLLEDLTYRPLRDVDVGDMVVTHLGRPRRVSRTYKRVWQGKMVTIQLLGDYRALSSTPDHPYFVRRGKSLETEVMPAKLVKKGDWLVMPKTNKHQKDTSLCSYERDPEFLWVLGLYLAEGSLDEHRVRFHLHYEETDFADRVKRTMEKYGATVSINRAEQYRRTTVCVSGGNWVKVFLELGNQHCYAKRINRRLMVIDPALQRFIVDGVADGDGHTRKSNGSHRTTIGITSQELLVQLRRILLRNGVTTSFTKHKSTPNRLQVYALQFHHNAKRTTYLQDDDNFYVKVRSVKSNPFEYHAGGNVYNLEVEEDNSYIVNDTATHNCAAYASCAASELQENVELCPEFTFALSKVLTGDPDQWGQNLRDIAKAHTKYGALEESLSPLHSPPEFVRRIENWPRVASLVSLAATHKKATYAFTKGNGDAFTNICSWLYKFSNEKRGVLLGLEWAWPANQSKIEAIAPGGFGHAVLALGWKGDYLKILNSWGENAGEQGIFWIHRNVIEANVQVYGALMFIDISPEQAKFYMENGVKYENASWWASIQIPFLKAILELYNQLITLLMLNKEKQIAMALAMKEFEGYAAPGEKARDGKVYPEGTLSWKNRNPGNLKWSRFMAGVKNGHAYFTTYDDGWRALLFQIEIAFDGRSKVYKPTDTLYDFFKKYSEANSKEYAEFIATALKVTPETTLRDALS